MRRLQKYKITKVLLIISFLAGSIGWMDTGLAHAISCSDSNFPPAQQQQCSDSESSAQSFCNNLPGNQQQSCSDSLAGCSTQTTVSNFLGCLNHLNAADQSGQSCPSGQAFQYNGTVLSCTPDSAQTSSGSSTPLNGAICDNPADCVNTPCTAASGDPVNCNSSLPTTTNCNSQNTCDLVAHYVQPAFELLSALVGVVAAISIIYGGIQYSTSEGDPKKVSAAKGRLIKTIIALIAYAFLFGFLEFLIPGGLFKAGP